MQSCSLVSFFLYSESNFRAAAPAAGCCCLPLMTALLSPLSTSYLTFPLPCFSLFLFQIAVSLNTEIAIIEGVFPCGENFIQNANIKAVQLKKRTPKKQIWIWLHFFSLMLAGNELSFQFVSVFVFTLLSTSMPCWDVKDFLFCVSQLSTRRPRHQFSKAFAKYYHLFKELCPGCKHPVSFKPAALNISLLERETRLLFSAASTAYRRMTN